LFLNACLAAANLGMLWRKQRDAQSTAGET
jgi:hypothetical protein